LKSAEPIYHRALDLAQRSKVRRYEARAKLSLASLCEADHRPDEALQFAQAALPFYKQAGYRRELVQTRILLAGAHADRAELDEAIGILREALPDAIQLHDAPIEAQTRERLGNVLNTQGHWPEALAEYKKVIPLLGARSIKAQIVHARLCGQLGMAQEAGRGFATVEAALDRNPNAALLLDLRTEQAQWAYISGRFAEAAAIAQRSSGIQTDDQETADWLTLVQNLATLRASHNPNAGGAVTAVIARFDREKLPTDAAEARLAVAQALAAGPNSGGALPFASAALEFYEPRRILESLWRAHAIAAHAAPRAADAEAHLSQSRAAFQDLRKLWPHTAMESYLSRPDIRLVSSYLER
jgi:hypothetical protein